MADHACDQHTRFQSREQCKGAAQPMAPWGEEGTGEGCSSPMFTGIRPMQQTSSNHGG